MSNPDPSETRRVASCAVVLACILLSALPALATLGEDVSSVRSDQAHMKTAVRILPGQFYSVHEMQVPAGTTVREFVSPAGIVFAISWQGPFSPDLRQLLGAHFDEFVQAAQSSSSRRARGRHLESGDLVFESGGHMRFMTGRAFLRSKIPSGTDANAIQ